MGLKLSAKKILPANMRTYLASDCGHRVLIAPLLHSCLKSGDEVELGERDLGNFRERQIDNDRRTETLDRDMKPCRGCRTAGSGQVAVPTLDKIKRSGRPIVSQQHGVD